MTVVPYCPSSKTRNTTLIARMTRPSRRYEPKPRAHGASVRRNDTTQPADGGEHDERQRVGRARHRGRHADRPQPPRAGMQRARQPLTHGAHSAAGAGPPTCRPRSGPGDDDARQRSPAPKPTIVATVVAEVDRAQGGGRTRSRSPSRTRRRVTSMPPSLATGRRRRRSTTSWSTRGRGRRIAASRCRRRGRGRWSPAMRRLAPVGGSAACVPSRSGRPSRRPHAVARREQSGVAGGARRRRGSAVAAGAAVGRASTAGWTRAAAVRRSQRVRRLPVDGRRRRVAGRWRVGRGAVRGRTTIPRSRRAVACDCRHRRCCNTTRHHAARSSTTSTRSSGGVLPHASLRARLAGDPADDAGKSARRLPCDAGLVERIEPAGHRHRWRSGRSRHRRAPGSRRRR